MWNALQKEVFSLLDSTSVTHYYKLLDAECTTTITVTRTTLCLKETYILVMSLRGITSDVKAGIALWLCDISCCVSNRLYVLVGGRSATMEEWVTESATLDDGATAGQGWAKTSTSAANNSTQGTWGGNQGNIQLVTMSQLNVWNICNLVLTWILAVWYMVTL